MRYDRRTVLKGGAIAVLGTATGCLDGSGNANGESASPTGTMGTPSGTTGTGRSDTAARGSTTTATTTTTTEPTSTATPTCESGLRPLRIDFPGNFELAYAEGFGFELSAEPSAVTVGDELTVSLRNATSEPRTTGPKAKYAIERRVSDGWQHVLEVPDGYTLPQGRLTHEPDEGFTWHFTASEDGFSTGPYTVCEPLRSGECHFTYWGFPGAKRGLTIGFEVE